MLPVSQNVKSAGAWSGTADLCYLTYEDRFFRRKKLKSVGGVEFIVDMPKTTHFDAGDAFVLDTGLLVEVVAEEERLIAVAGHDPARMAWHIGNRHTPCQIEGDRLLIREDAVIRGMLERLGATLTDVVAPFTPEGGAYGHGRTHAHEHGKTAHGH